MNKDNRKLTKLREKYQKAKEQYEYWTSGGKCEPGSKKWMEVESQYLSAKDGYEFALKEIDHQIDQKEEEQENIIVFISYSHIDREPVGKIKKELEHYGFEVFVAHDDIEPSQEWKAVIEKNLNSCLIFIPYITINFPKSKWTEQECGIAYEQKKIIIPLFYDIKPYGFIEIFQGLKMNSKSIDKLSKELVNIILKKINLEEYKKYFINKFINSKHFDDANYRTFILKKYSEFSDEQINLICVKSIENNQVYDAFRAKDFLKDLIKKNKNIINPNNYRRLKELL